MLPKKLSPGKVFFRGWESQPTSTNHDSMPLADINQPWLYGLNQHQPTINQPFLYGVFFTRDSQQSRKKTLLGIPHKYHWLGSMGNGCDWTLAGGYRTTKMMASLREWLVWYTSLWQVYDIYYLGYTIYCLMMFHIRFCMVKKAPHVQTQSGF